MSTIAGNDGRTTACLAAALARAVAASAGDLALLWVAWAHDGRFGFAHPPPGTLVAGHYLGVLGIPLYGLGYWVLARGLHATAPWAALFVAALGTVGSVVGAVVHGITGVLIASAIRTGGSTAPDALGGHLGAAYVIPLWVIVGKAVTWGSIVFATLVARGATRWPRRLALANPLLVTITIAVLALPFPLLAAFAVPAAPNLAHVVFFATALAAARRQ